MWRKFLSEYLKSPRTVGAIAPSSEKLADKMIGPILSKANCIIEYGPGTGVFTNKILSKIGQNTTLMLIEYNEEFYNKLKEKYMSYRNVIVINDTAENVKKYIDQYDIKEVNYIVSGLPFTSLPVEISDKILRETREVLSHDGYFITFQYTLLKKEYIKSFFKEIEIERVLFNFPPAYVLNCRNC